MALRELGLQRLDIYQPSLLLGDRGELRPGERLGVLLAPLLKPLLIGPLAKYAPIHARDLAKAMIAGEVI